MNFLHGEEAPRAKVMDHEVEFMRRLRSAGMSIAELSEKFDLSKAQVSKICAWRQRTGVKDRRKE